MNLWPLLKIAAVFAAMLAGIRYRLGLAPSILLGTVLTAVLFPLAPSAFLATALSALTQDTTLYLCAILGLILMFSDMFEKSGQAERFMAALAGYLPRPRLRLIFFPALIGLLPMPGGAIFSAPMIKSAAKGLDVPPRELAVLNYWFRHVWEACWPLYPGIILAASLSGLPIGSIIILTCPGTIVSLLLGWQFLLRPGVLPLAVPETNGGAAPRRESRVALREGLPLILAIGGAVLGEMLISILAPGAPFEIGIMLALTLGIVAVMVQNRLPLAELRRSLFKKHLATMLSVIAAIFVFKEVLAAAGVVTQLAQAAGGEAALIASATLLPFVVGLLAGITLAYVGAAFPLMLGMLSELGMQAQTPAWIVLGIFSGFTGVMASPIHICFVLTCQYFGVDLGPTWRRIALPCALLLSFGAGLFLVLLRFFPV